MPLANTSQFIQTCNKLDFFFAVAYSQECSFIWIRKPRNYEPSEFIPPAIIAEMEPALLASRLSKRSERLWKFIYDAKFNAIERKKRKKRSIIWPPFVHFNTPEMKLKYLNYTLAWTKIGWEKTRCLLPVWLQLMCKKKTTHYWVILASYDQHGLYAAWRRTCSDRSRT